MTKIIVALFVGSYLLVSAVVWSQVNYDVTRDSTEPKRYVPVPPELAGFQAGLLAAFVWDGSEGAHEWNNIYDDLGIFVEYEDGNTFGLATSVGITTQDKITASRSDDGLTTPLGHWYELNEGVIYFALGPLYFHGGLNVNRDIVETPYSLFFSSNDTSVLNAAFGYQGEVFGVKSQWLGLNGPTSVVSPLERGANYREYTVTIDPVRFGFQEWIVYFEEFINPIYFLVPIPVTVTEIFLGATLNPARTSPDSNTMFGIFFEYDQDPLYTLLQLQVDDLTFSDVLKVGWSTGVRYRSEIGTFGFYHAGATKHTYASAKYDDPDNQRSYRAFTYYPVNSYSSSESRRTLWYFDNYIGYKYGENNLAFMVDYTNRFAIVNLRAALEYVVSGAKSPLNPWHGEDHSQQNTALLDDGVLAHTISVALGVGVDVFEDITVLFEGAIGVAINELRLDTSSNIFAPVSAVRALHYLFIGVQYNYNAHTSQWRIDRRIPSKR